MMYFFFPSRRGVSEDLPPPLPFPFPQLFRLFSFRPVGVRVRLPSPLRVGFFPQCERESIPFFPFLLPWQPLQRTYSHASLLLEMSPPSPSLSKVSFCFSRTKSGATFFPRHFPFLISFFPRRESSLSSALIFPTHAIAFFFHRQWSFSPSFFPIYFLPLPHFLPREVSFPFFPVPLRPWSLVDEENSFFEDKISSFCSSPLTKRSAD